MFATFLSVALFSTLAVQGARADLVLDTPSSLTQCQNVTITWTPTSGPYNLIVVPTDDPCGDIIADLGDFDGTSASWNVNVTAGQSVTLSLEDSQGNEAWSGAVTVGGGSSACLDIASSSPAGSSVPSSTLGASSTPSSPSNAADPATTLVVNPEATPNAVSSGSAPPSSSGAVAVGAAGANLGPSESGASSMRQYSASIAILTVLAAVAMSM